MPTEQQILSEEQLIILVRAALVMAQRVCHARFCDPHPMGQAEVCKATEEGVQQFDALCATVRALRAENQELKESVTHWQAEALLNHFCSSHASNKRQLGHYCTVCAKPFSMTVPQGTRVLTYNQLQARLSEVEKERDDLRTRLKAAMEIPLVISNSRKETK